MDSAEELFAQIKIANLMAENVWQVRQNDELDRLTSHIYACRTASDLEVHSVEKKLSPSQSLYAIHRWRNFKRHEAWLSLLLEQVPFLAPSLDRFDKTTDFRIQISGQSIPFDLKVTRYPQSVGPNFTDFELANWFYKNQSQQGRHHLANRFFVVGQPEFAVYDLGLARKAVSEFVCNASKYRHFITHSDGSKSRAVVLRQVL